MKKLFGSLAFRLSIAIAAILVAAFFGLVLAYQQSIKMEFHEFVEVESEIGGKVLEINTDLAEILSGVYQAGGWAELLNAVPEGPYLILDTKGAIRHGEFRGGQDAVFSNPREGVYEVTIELGGGDDNQVWLTGVPGVPMETDSGEVFGHLLFVPGPELPDRGAGFATSVFEGTIWFIIPITLLTLILVGFSVRAGLNPVHQLTKAAKTLKGGTIPKPVKAKASGEVGDLVTAFNSAVEELSKTDEMRKQFITAAAHEMRTPVTNLKGQLEALEAGLIKKDKEFLAVMQAETGLLESLIGDLQDLAISDAGRLKVFPETLNLSAELEDAWKGFYGAKTAKLENKVGTKIEVQADPRRLRQILLNLFSNALNARHKGLVLGAEAKVLADMVEISLTDNGPGIDPKDLPHIFERFYRADQSRTRDTGGAGLGLSIVKTFVEAHGGSIKAESLAKKGARITFSLPLSK